MKKRVDFFAGTDAVPRGEGYVIKGDFKGCDIVAGCVTHGGVVFLFVLFGYVLILA